MENQNTQFKRIVKKIRQGSRNAFAQLFHLTNRKVYSQARKFGLSHEEAEEVVQEVYLTLWNQREKLNPERNPEAYLFKVSKSYIIKAFRHNAYKIAYQQALQKPLNFNSTNDVLAELELKDLESYLNQAIELLPEKRKTIFLLSRKENLSHVEIALLLNISVRTVENQIYQAIKFLKSRCVELDMFILSLIFIIS